eukprot:gene1697-biopygen1463
MDRLAAHPEDTVCWAGNVHQEQRLDPLSFAAEAGHLSTWVKVVLHDRPVPHFTQHAGPFVIRLPARHSDVSKMGPADAARFEFDIGVIRSR